MSRQNSGCGMLLLGALVIGALLWVVGVALWLLAIAAPVAGFAGAGYFLLRARQSRELLDDRAAVDAELEALAQDAVLDLADTITRWDMLMVTKGIGTDLEGREEEARQIQRQLFAAQESLLSAPSLAHRLAAVVHADTIRETTERHL